jgi:hypothetical protein
MNGERQARYHDQRREHPKQHKRSTGRPARKGPALRVLSADQHLSGNRASRVKRDHAPALKVLIEQQVTDAAQKP